MARWPNSPPPLRGRRRRYSGCTRRSATRATTRPLEYWRNLSRWVRVGTSLALPLGFALGTSIQAQRVYYDGEGGAHLTLDDRPRRDRNRSFSVLVLNRAFTVYGFSLQLALIHDTRLTDAQAQNFDRNRAELRFVRQF